MMLISFPSPTSRNRELTSVVLVHTHMLDNQDSKATTKCRVTSSQIKVAQKHLFWSQNTCSNAGYIKDTLRETIMFQWITLSSQILRKKITLGSTQHQSTRVLSHPWNSTLDTKNYANLRSGTLKPLNVCSFCCHFDIAISLPFVGKTASARQSSIPYYDCTLLGLHKLLIEGTQLWLRRWHGCRSRKHGGIGSSRSSLLLRWVGQYLDVTL